MTSPDVLTDAATADVWTFGDSHDGSHGYSDGTTVPHRAWKVYLNGVAVGEIDVHMHRRRGRDGQTDVSFGMTPVVYGPIPTVGGRS